MARNRIPQDATPCDKPELRPLTPKQLQAAQLVAVGNSDEEIANVHGACRSTVHRWRTLSPLFQAEVNRHRAVMADKISDKLRDSVLKAVDTVTQLMTNSEDEGIKLKAASMLLGLVPLSIHAGPTDPCEIVRPLAEQRNLDTPSSHDRSLHLYKGTKPINELIQDVLIERERLANDPTCDSFGDNTSDGDTQ